MLMLFLQKYYDNLFRDKKNIANDLNDIEKHMKEVSVFYEIICIHCLIILKNVLFDKFH